MFEVAEYAARRECVPHFLIELPLSLVLHVVDGEARYDDVKDARRRKRLLKVVRNDLHAPGRAESLPETIEHGRRKIDGSSDGFWSRAENQVQQSAIAGTEIQNALNGLGQFFEQDRFAGGTMRHAVGLLEVVQRMFDGLPLAHTLERMRQSRRLFQLRIRM